MIILYLEILNLFLDLTWRVKWIISFSYQEFHESRPTVFDRVMLLYLSIIKWMTLL